VATLDKTTVILRARAQSVSHARADVRIRDLTVAIDEPLERGGTNAGPTPTDLALAALVGCTNVIGHKCAARLGMDIGRLEIDATCEFDRRGVTQVEEIEVPFKSVILIVVSDGTASDADLARLSEEVERFCPLSKLFRNAGAKLSISWKNQQD
jgi:uncharacterized OsmC-like protein